MRRQWTRFVLIVLAASLWQGCTSSNAPGETADAAPPAPDAQPKYPAPSDDVVPRVGSDSSLDIATWNIENFPLLASTPRLMADLITSLDLDLIAVQEIADINAFTELVDRLPNHTQLLSSHTYGDGSYQKVGFIYNRNVLELTGGRLLFQSEGYKFPRPPLQATAKVIAPGADPVEFTIIVVHLKAGYDNEDRDRRQQAGLLLEQYVRDQVGGDGDTDVIILGDFNEVLTSANGLEVFAPWIDAPERYAFRTQPLADSGQASFVPTGAILDHVISTSSLNDEFAGGTEQIPRLEIQFGSYIDTISDHLPVVVSMPILAP